MRIKRGTLRSEKRSDRVYVLLRSRPTTEQTTEQTPDHTAELIVTLREQLQAERQAHAEARRLLAAALERIPTIEAPRKAEASVGVETVEEAPDRAEPWSAEGEVREELGAERARREMAESTLRDGMAEERRRREEAERERDDLRRELFGLGKRTEAHETAEEQQGRGQPHSDAPGPQEGAQRVSWWRRMFRR
jgi:hypothetical protein